MERKKKASISLRKIIFEKKRLPVGKETGSIKMPPSSSKKPKKK